MNINKSLCTLIIIVVSTIFAGCSSNDDDTPDAFTFQGIENQELGSIVISQSITVTGIDKASGISISGGEYSVNNNAFTSAAGTVENNDQIRVQQTTSTDYDKSISTDLTIGGVLGMFISTTKQAPLAFRSSVTNIDLRSIETGQALTEGDEVFDGTNVTLEK